MCEVVAGAGAHEGCMGCIWDGSGMLRRGQACQRAKAEGSIDEKGVRGCGDRKRGDSELYEWPPLSVTVSCLVVWWGCCLPKWTMLGEAVGCGQEQLGEIR